MSVPTIDSHQSPPGAKVGVPLLGLLERDMFLLRANSREFVARAVIQPLMLLFVFSYVFPRIGQTYVSTTASFATVLTPGLIGYAAFYAGVYTVGMSLALELSYGRPGLDDRLLAPLPTWALGAEKAMMGAINGILAGALVLCIAMAIPASHLNIGMPAPVIAAGSIVVVGLLAAGAGMFVGTAVKPERLPALFTIVLIPIAFLGCIYFSWSRLAGIRWLQIVVLLNPLTYMTESVRTLLTPSAPHMPTWGALLGGCAVAVSMLLVGLRSFTRRVIG